MSLITPSYSTNEALLGNVELKHLNEGIPEVIPVLISCRVFSLDENFEIFEK